MDPRRIFDHIFTVEVIIAAVVFGLVCFAVVLALALSAARKRAGRPATRAEEHLRIELGYAAAVAVVAAFVIGLSFHANAQEHVKAPEDATKIRVTGFQWCWRFSYPQGGRAVTGTCQRGQEPTMVVPVGRPVTVEVTSADVIHSWWVPGLRIKIDAFPDHVNRATIEVDRAGEWTGRCAEFCGTLHTYMDFHLKAVPERQYEKWLAGAAA
jgi:cytochrome c oxidase subunit II